jgi:hypothetical protein
MSNFTKIRSLGAELLHAGGETDMTTLIVAFRNSANAAKNQDRHKYPSRIRTHDPTDQAGRIYVTRPLQ